MRPAPPRCRRAFHSTAPAQWPHAGTPAGIQRARAARAARLAVSAAQDAPSPRAAPDARLARTSETDPPGASLQSRRHRLLSASVEVEQVPALSGSSVKSRTAARRSSGSARAASSGFVAQHAETGLMSRCDASVDLPAPCEPRITTAPARAPPGTGVQHARIPAGPASPPPAFPAPDGRTRAGCVRQQAGGDSSGRTPARAVNADGELVCDVKLRLVGSGRPTLHQRLSRAGAARRPVETWTSSVTGLGRDRMSRRRRIPQIRGGQRDHLSTVSDDSQRVAWDDVCCLEVRLGNGKS